jgi:hypothetical protein
VLVDAPCSNTGVLGRRPEVRWRLKPDDLRHLTEMQTRLLRLAVERVRPAGGESRCGGDGATGVTEANAGGGGRVGAGAAGGWRVLGAVAERASRVSGGRTPLALSSPR